MRFNTSGSRAMRVSPDTERKSLEAWDEAAIEARARSPGAPIGGEILAGFALAVISLRRL